MSETIETMTILASRAGDKQFVLLKDVVIPAGTILDTAPVERGGRAHVEAIIAMGDDAVAYFNMNVRAIADTPRNLITETK